MRARGISLCEDGWEDQPLELDVCVFQSDNIHLPCSDFARSRHLLAHRDGGSGKTDMNIQFSYGYTFSGKK